MADPAVTRAYVQGLCASDETVALQEVSGVDHVSTGRQAGPAVARWVAHRFAGGAPESTCGAGS